MQIKITYILVIVAGLLCSQSFAQQAKKMSSGGTGYLEYLPDGYGSNSNTYPIVISLHGIKEKGNSLTSLDLVDNVGLPKYVKYGQKYPFILISPQLKTSMGKWTGAYVVEVLNHVKKYLRVDPKRIYLTGLSLGGGGVWSVATSNPEPWAAILPICTGYNVLSLASNIARENIPTWGFHGDKDYVVSYTVTQKMVNGINASTPKPSPLAKFTIFPGMGHVIWDKVYKETTALTWMLGVRKGTTTGGTEPTPPPTNQIPVVSAGGDKTIYLPTSSTSLQGSASDADGSISSYAWTKTSGSSCTLSGTTSSKLTTSGMPAGTYYFRLTVKDDKGASKYDEVKVVVSSSSTTTNKLPIVSAGSDKTTTNKGMTIVGSASDSDGSIATYKWTKISGPSIAMSNTTTSKLWASNLVAGTYYFRLTVTDNKGGTKYDDMKLVVYNSTASLNGELQLKLEKLKSDNKSQKHFAALDTNDLPYREVLKRQELSLPNAVTESRRRIS
jgi:hypothetical protein